MAPATKALIVLIVSIATSHVVAYRKILKSETLASGKWSCLCRMSASSRLKESGKDSRGIECVGMVERIVWDQLHIRE
jgi:hypothetical protein